MAYKQVVYAQIAAEAREEFPAWMRKDHVTRLTPELVQKIIEQPALESGPLVDFIRDRAVVYGLDN